MKQNKAFLYIFGVVSLLCLLFGMVMFSLQHTAFLGFLLFAGFLAFYLGVSYFIGIFGKPFDLAKHDALVLDFLRQPHRPSVDVYLPSCGEDVSVINNTFFWVKQLRWGGDLKVHVLDDSHRQEVEKLAKLYGYNYIARPNKGELKKAGNIRYAFTRTSGDFIVILDADFCPRPDFVSELLPYFFHNEKTAIVQSPQYFRIVPGQTWVAKGAAYIQELFYRLIQVSRNTWDASICVGTCAIYRRSTLAPFGGTAAIPYSEDLHTGFMLLSAGYHLRYVPLNLSAGLCPDNAAGFFTQQYRWCLGSTSLFLSKKFWAARMPVMQRLCFMSGMMYYTATALGLFLTPLPGLGMVWLRPEHVFWYNMLFSVPSFVFGTLYMALWSKAPFSLGALQARVVGYTSHAFALVDKMRGSLMPWVPTGGKQNERRVTQAWWLICLWNNLVFWLGASGVFLQNHAQPFHNFVPFLLFSAFHYYVAMRALTHWK